MSKRDDINELYRLVWKLQREVESVQADIRRVQDSADPSGHMVGSPPVDDGVDMTRKPYIWRSR